MKDSFNSRSVTPVAGPLQKTELKTAGLKPGSASTSRVASLTNLYYRNSEEWRPLPAWAYSLLGLGAYLSKITPSRSRRVVALKAPVRLYATAFLSAGIVLERTFELAATERRAARFERLWELKDGSSVYIFQNSTRFRGVIYGHEEYGERRSLRVKTELTRTGTGSEWVVSPQLAHIVQPADGDFRLRGKQRGVKVELPGLFTGLLAVYDVLPTWYSSVECLIAGTATLLEDEVSLELQLKRKEGSVEGRLCDLLLPRRCVPRGDVYRSEIISSRTEDITEEEPLLAAHSTVLIDGATAFLRMGDMWPSSTIVVLLDPHDTMFGEAVQQLNLWHTRRLSNVDYELNLPPWLEAMTFLERIRNGA